jgi:glutaredoxin
MDSAVASAAPAGDGRLPYPLRVAAARYPVTLYTSRDCGVCDSARAHLTQRGIPFAEQSLRTEADVQTFKRLGFTEQSVPALAVGREKTGGFDPQGWDQLLDAAGYPKTSMLPRGWQARTGATSSTASAAGASASAPSGGSATASPTASPTADTAATPAADASGVPERDFASPLSVKRTQAPTAQPARLATPASSLRF